MLPLVTRTCRSLSAWLSPAFLPLSASGRGGGGLELKPDLDLLAGRLRQRSRRWPPSATHPAGGGQVSKWTRLEKATFLTANEKRAETGYDRVSGGDQLKYADADRLGSKFNPGQPRVPAGNPNGGQ